MSNHGDIFFIKLSFLFFLYSNKLPCKCKDWAAKSNITIFLTIYLNIDVVTILDWMTVFTFTKYEHNQR